MAEEEKYKDIKKYVKRADAGEKIIKHLNLKHGEIYHKAALEVLQVKDEDGNVVPNQTDQKLLKKAEYQKKMANKMADLYKEGVGDYFSKVKKQFAKEDKKWDMSEFDEALLTRAVYGTTRAELREHISDHKEGFSQDFFMNQLRPSLTRTMTKDLLGASGKHLDQANLDDIIGYTKIGDIVDKSKMTVEDAKEYLDIHRRQGSIGEHQIDERHKKKKE